MFRLLIYLLYLHPRLLQPVLLLIFTFRLFLTEA